MELKNIFIAIGIIVIGILFYKFVPTTFKKFIFFLIILITITFFTIKYFMERIGGTQ